MVPQIANNWARLKELEPHPLEAIALTVPPETETMVDLEATPALPVMCFHDIYVDDFIMGIQGPPKKRKEHLRRLLHAIDKVFRPLDNEDGPTRNHAPSVKKLLKGDAYPATRKQILGWIVDTLRGTLELPSHRLLFSASPAAF